MKPEIGVGARRVAMKGHVEHVGARVKDVLGTVAVVVVDVNYADTLTGLA